MYYCVLFLFLLAHLRIFSESSPIRTGFLPTVKGIGEVQAHDNINYRYLHSQSKGEFTRH
jgi:hypothetical protein